MDRRSLVLAVLAGTGVGLALLTPIAAPRVLSRAAATAPAATAPATPTDARCAVAYDKVASPGVVQLGDEVDLKLPLRAACDRVPLRMVLVLEASISLHGFDGNLMKARATRFLPAGSGEPWPPQDEVGIIGFRSTSLIRCPLTKSWAALDACIRSIDFVGRSDVDVGIREATHMIERARPPEGQPASHREAIVLFARANFFGCDPVLEAAEEAKRSGVLVTAACVGWDCDQACMRQVASRSGTFFDWRDWEDEKEVDQITFSVMDPTLMKHLTITDMLPDNMPYVPNSARPGNTPIFRPEPNLTWTLDLKQPSLAYTMTYRVLPQQAGTFPTNKKATGLIETWGGGRYFWTYPVPTVVIVGRETPTPPADPTSATPTTTDNPPTPTPTARGRPDTGRTLWLPALSLERARR